MSNPRHAATVLLTLAALGCGSSNPATYPVTGRVTLDGQPMSYGVITFHPANGRPATGDIEEGRIVNVTTFEPGDGVVAGSHRVAISAMQRNPNPETAMSRAPLSPPAYADPNQSNLTAEVRADADNDLLFELVTESETP